MTNILEVSALEQSFRVGFWLKKTPILHGIELVVPERSVFGFLGANGAGKTTLIHLIVGLRRPKAGRVLVCGLDAHERAARARVGYLPERPYFHEHLTGQGFLDYFGALAGMSRKQVRDRTPRVLAAVGMSQARELELKRYSKGMLQRIGIAQAILHDPQFLVLDEPMSGLDPIGRKEIRELIGQLSSEGRTVFFSSHVIPDVEAICDQVGLISRGRIIGCGPISQFLAQGPLRVEITASGIALEAARAALGGAGELRGIADGIRGVFEGAESAERALRALLGAHAQIVSVSPVRPSLESFFADGGQQR